MFSLPVGFCLACLRAGLFLVVPGNRQLLGCALAVCSERASVCAAPFAAGLRYWLELESREESQGDVEEPSFPLHQTVPCRLVADLFRPSLLGHLGEVAEDADVGAKHEVFPDHKTGLDRDVVAEGAGRRGLAAVESAVGQLGQRHGAVNRYQRAERSPGLQLEPACRHPLHAGFGADEERLPVDELVEPVHRHVGSSHQRLLPEVVPEVQSREEPNIRIASEEDIGVDPPPLARVPIVVETVEAEGVLPLECEHPILPAMSARLRHLVGVVGFLLGGLNEALYLGHGRRRRYGSDGHAERVAAVASTPTELVGGRRVADLNRPLHPFRELVAGGRLVVGLVHADANTGAGPRVGPFRADRNELSLSIVALEPLADQPEGHGLTLLAGDGDAAVAGSGGRGVDSCAAGPEGRESAMLHTVTVGVTPAWAGVGGPRDADAHEGREDGNR